VTAGVLLGPRLLSVQPTAQSFQTEQVRRGRLTSTISGTGTIVPLTSVKLSFKSGGRLTEMNVKLGDSVKKGQSLAKLDTAELALQVTQARASLSSAQAKLAATKAGSRPEEIKSAHAQLDAARAKLDSMLAGGRPEEIASAKASLDSARTKLAQVQAGSSDADIRAAEQSVVSADAVLAKADNDFAKLKAGAAPEDIRNAELDLERAKNSLWSSQTSRDGTCGGRAQQYQCDAANASVAAAETAVSVSRNNLEKLKAPPKPEDIIAAEKNSASARAQLVSARARLDLVRSGARLEDIAAAQASAIQAEQSLILKQKPYTDADIQAQRQSVAAAEAQLATRLAPYTDADILSAQAAVDQAKAQLDLAQLNLTNAELTAPFDGVVSSVAGNVGEYAAGSAASPVVALVSIGEMRLDVTVDEADVSKVQVGQNTTVTLDAVGPQPLSGKVAAVAPSATIQSGVATYQVSISLPAAAVAKAGMTATATITYAERNEVLMLSNRAIRTQGRNRVVEVQAGDKSDQRQVRVGLSNDQMTEIVEGVSEGDTVIIRATTAVAPRTGMGPGPGPGPGPGGPGPAMVTK
jgi:HlyD family secretion protein